MGPGQELLQEGINEVIVTTHYNAAPIGIINRKGRLTMVLFHGSHTEENVRRDGWVVANFIFDPLIYVKTAFEDLPEDEIHFVEEIVDGLTVHRLEGVEAWGAYRCTVERSTNEALIVSLTPVYEEITGLRLHPVNRGFASVIEATVHATRYVRNKDPRLRELIEHHAGLVRKCGGERDVEAIEYLLKRL
ncbi:MAG: DUF447 family protein [Methanogenium sp.]|nr:DUF447 family protein [Methanogenium sp.]